MAAEIVNLPLCFSLVLQCM